MFCQAEPTKIFVRWLGHHLSRQFFGEFCLIWNKKKRVMRFIFRLLSFVCDPESSCAVSIWFSFWCKERGKNFFDWVLSSSDCKLSCWKNNTFVSKNSVYNLTFFSENPRSTFSWCQVATLRVRKSIFFPLRMYLKTSI